MQLEQAADTEGQYGFKACSFPARRSIDANTFAFR
jgi:hypothetical protein